MAKMMLEEAVLMRRLFSIFPEVSEEDSKGDVGVG